MNEILEFTADQVVPGRTDVFENQGIPAGKAVPQTTEALYVAALDLLAEVGAPVGILAEISADEFEVVYRGEGCNQPKTPVGDILGRAADRQGAGQNRHFGLSTQAFQEAQARAIFADWADTLRDFLDEHYKTQSLDRSRRLGVILDAYADPRTYGITGTLAF